MAIEPITETSFLFGRLTWAALPLHEPILVVTFVVVALGGIAAPRGAHLLPRSGAISGTSGSPRSTTRRSGSCT